MREKVAVVGAGTSGLIVAKILSGLDIKTTVYEQKHRLGYPPKASGIVSIEGLKSLGTDYRGAIINTLYGANIHADSEVFRVRSREPRAHVLDRVRFNEICYAEALESGASVRKSEKVDDEMLDELHKSNIIIGADGPLSTVARHFSMGGIKKYTLTYKAEFDARAPDDKIVDMFFDRSITPGFFAWLCPKSRDLLEVGIGIDSGHGNSKSAFDRFVRSREVAEILDKSKMLNGYASVIPMETARRVVDEKQEVLLVGDAAGHIKQTTGGGIVFGGNAAIMAAKTVADYIKSGGSLKDYENLFNKKFGVDIFLHSLIKRLYSNMSTDRIAFILKISKVLGLDTFLSDYGDMDKPSVIIKRLFSRRR